MDTKEPERLTVTVKEAAKILGLSRNSTYEACRQGKIPHITIGRRILIPRAGLIMMLVEGGEEKEVKQ
jgi:excisionase family DNA binding protein